MRELELWIVVAFGIFLAWSLFGLFVLSHSYVMFLPLKESLKYDDAGSALIGVALIVINLAYVAAAFLRLASVVCAFGAKGRRNTQAATPSL